jgi:acetylornithine deacetylase/succinyl-diaminopimelate desuccinylase-like protein
MNRAAIYRYIDDHLEEHIALIQEWVQQPSVSWDRAPLAAPNMHQMAELAAQSYSHLGCQEVEVIDGRFHPGVWAYYDAGA